MNLSEISDLRKFLLLAFYRGFTHGSNLNVPSISVSFQNLHPVWKLFLASVIKLSDRCLTIPRCIGRLHVSTQIANTFTHGLIQMSSFLMFINIPTSMYQKPITLMSHLLGQLNKPDLALTQLWQWCVTFRKSKFDFLLLSHTAEPHNKTILNSGFPTP